MMTQPKGKLVMSSLVAVVAALALAASIAYTFPSPNSTETQTYPLRLSASGSGWNFTASINSSSIRAGQSILLMTSLTNTSPSNQTITPYVNPYINPSVYAMNGTELWAWNPSQATWPNATIKSGQSISGNVVIPTSQLRAGQTYLIKVVPLSTQFLTPNNFALIFQFSVSSCTGYPPGGNCLATYSYTFTISVNYSGPWKLSYQGYNSLGKSNPLPVSGNYTGSGFYSKDVTLSGPNNSGLTLCARAQKLDGSDSTLILAVTGYNETSLPYGSTSYCGGVAP